MARLQKNDQFPDFIVNTIFGRNIKLSELVGDQKTALLFLRYEGCTLCRFDMLLLKDDYQKIMGTGGKVLVVLQSDPDRLKNEISKDFYPYNIICDPDQKLYKELEIIPAISMEAMIGPGTMEKIRQVEASGLTHGSYEGEELQLPAIFIVDNDLKILYEHYSEYITDLPDMDKLANLLSN
jgi:peroxiredoxin